MLRTRMTDDDERGAHEEREVSSQRPGPHVVEIEVAIHTEVAVVSTLELPEAGDALGQLLALEELSGELRPFLRERWTQIGRAHV